MGHRAWMRGELMFDGNLMTRRVLGEAVALGEIIAQQSIGVLVTAKLRG